MKNKIYATSASAFAIFVKPTHAHARTRKHTHTHTHTQRRDTINLFNSLSFTESRPFPTSACHSP